MQTESPVIGIYCADIHLRLRAPIARSAEPDWLAAMRRPLLQLTSLSETHNAPIFVAGDIFDRWNSSPELINWALRHMPTVYAVPGQHDLPFHQYHNLEKSAYFTLCQAGKVNHLCGEAFVNGQWVTGWPWGFEVQPLKGKHDDDSPRVALIHAYIWKKGYGHANAPQDAIVREWRERLEGYDIAVFGDNHQPFESVGVFNCGGFMRRRSDERDLRPRVGLLHADGRMESHELDCSEDQFLADTELPQGFHQQLEQYDNLMDFLADTPDVVLNFAEALKHAVSDDKLLRDFIIKILEGVNESR